MVDEKEVRDFPFIGIVEPGLGGGLNMSRLKEGCSLLIHETQMKETSIMRILKISMKTIDLRCQCGNPSCNLVLRLRVERAGAHPKRTDV